MYSGKLSRSVRSDQFRGVNFRGMLKPIISAIRWVQHAQISWRKLLQVALYMTTKFVNVSPEKFSAIR